MDKEYFLKRLNATNPLKLQTYSYDHLPETFLATDKVPIECLKHGIFYQKVCSHLFSSGCPECGKEKTLSSRTNTKQEFINRSISRFGDRFNYDKTVYTKQDCELTITCKVHGDLTLTPLAHFWSTYGCAKCDYEIPRAKRFNIALERARQIHGDKYDYSRINYVNSSEKVEIVCPIHGSFWQSMFSHSKDGNECPKCSKDKERVTLDEFIARSRKLHCDKDSYDKTNYSVLQDEVTITCKVHGDYTQRANSHLAGYRCRKCHIDEYLLSKEQFVRNAKEVHGDAYDYSKVVYKGNKVPVEIDCKKHGAFWIKPNAHVASRGRCPRCAQSNGEEFVETFLLKYNFKYVRQYVIKPFRYRYDFFLPDHNLFIEYNGLQHYKPIDFFGGEKTFLSTQERDEHKKDIVRNNKGKLLIVPHTFNTVPAVEAELIRLMKRANAKWYVIDGKVVVFKKVIEVFSYFNIPMTILIRNLDKEVQKRVKSFQVLF